MLMTSKQRFLKVLNRQIPDRLPVTTHHVMPYFLDEYMNGMGVQEFFAYFGFDPILWTVEHLPDEANGDYFDPEQGELAYLEAPRICSDNWRIKTEIIDDPVYAATKFTIQTPAKSLSMVLQGNDQTVWVAEPLLKEKKDGEIFARFAPAPLCNVESVNRQYEAYGERGLVRGMIPGFDIYGQPGCWQDAAVLFGVENLIIETFSDPEWVHELLRVLLVRKRKYIESLKNAHFDLIELGGGSASSTVISPDIFDKFVAPYDGKLIEAAHLNDQRIVYHTCGGMTPLLEMIADMKPDAMETFTPKSMGGDVELREAKNRIGDRTVMIGGFDQFHFLKDCPPDETRKAVRKCFESAGEGGGYILAPSDHFFDADEECLRAFADEAKKCTY